MPTLLAAADQPAGELPADEQPAPPATVPVSRTAGSATGPADYHLGDRSAVCLSGGGIRSASYCLGALQAMEQSDNVAQAVTTMTAVSGGSYIGASKATVEQPLRAQDRPAVYALQSPEEQHLRRHTHYLMPDAATTLRSVLCVLFGLLQNLSMLCSWLLLAALPAGWLLRASGALTQMSHFGDRCHSGPPGGGCPTFSPGSWVWLPGALLGVCLLLFAASSSGISNLHRWTFHSGKRSSELPPAQGCRSAADEHGLRRVLSCASVQSAMFAFFLTALAAAFAVLLAPWLIQQIGRQDVPGLRSVQAPHARNTLQTVAALFTGLAALVRLVVGRLTPAKAGSATGGVTGAVAGWVSRVWAVVQHAVLPWLGSVVAVLLLALVWLTAEYEGAYWGVRAEGVWVVAGAAGYLVAGRLLVDVNRTSLHSLYRDRLASAFAVRRGDNGQVVAAGNTLLSNLGGPVGDVTGGLSYELVICATANINASGQVPAGTNGISFTFTPSSSGLQAPMRNSDATSGLYRLVPTEQYEKVVGHRHLTLFDMVAISGAAVSPLMGKLSRPPERFLLAMANVRLGVWLPHPALMPEGPTHPAQRQGLSGSEQKMLDRLTTRRSRRFTAMLARRVELSDDQDRHPSRLISELRWRAAQPGVRLLLREAMGKLSLTNRWLYVTDGGHYDNLGLVEALRRQPAEVFVFDASGDKTTSWSTIGQAVALARIELGVEIRVDPLTNLDDKGAVLLPFVRGEFTAPAHWQVGPAIVPIWFTKLGVWPQAPWDVQAYGDRHTSFPTDSTLQQLYDGEEFEAYRALGFAATTRMLEERATAATGQHAG